METSLDRMLGYGIDKSFDSRTGIYRYEIDTGYCCEIVKNRDKMVDYVTRCNDLIIKSLNEDGMPEPFQVGFNGQYIGEYIGVLEKMMEKGESKSKDVDLFVRKLSYQILQSFAIIGAGIGGFCGILLPQKVGFELGIFSGGIVGGLISLPLISKTTKVMQKLYGLHHQMYKRRNEFGLVLYNADEESIEHYERLNESLEEDEEDY